MAGHGLPVTTAHVQRGQPGNSHGDQEPLHCRHKAVALL